MSGMRIFFFFLLVSVTEAFLAPACRGPRSAVRVEAKKKKKGGGGGGGGGKKGGSSDEFLAAASRQYAFTLSKLTKKVGDGRTVLDKIDLMFFHGAKIGVCGRNGCGKSTLMKIMAGVDTEFEGVAKKGDGLKVGYLPQEPHLIGETVEDAIAPAIEIAKATLAEFEVISQKLTEPDCDVDALMEELGKVQDKIDAGDLWELDRKVSVVTDALRCPPLDAKNEYLSGGEQRRVALARLLLEDNDMLLLDEPTNHLDSESVAWLEAYLQNFKGTVVLITHDRYFLERITKWILEIDSAKSYPFEGSYAAWLEHKAKSLQEAAQSNNQRQLDSFLAELQAFQDRSDAQRPAKQRLAAYESLLAGSSSSEMSNAQLYIPSGPRLGTDVIKVEALKKAYGDRVLFEDVTFEIPRGAIVGICGPNGAGKSSLVKSMTGELEPTDGKVHLGSTVVLATGAQTREALDSRGRDATVFDAVCDGMDSVDLGTREVPARLYVSWYGFTGTAQQRPVSALSGGERNRAFLARQLRANGNVLVLDEPTNDLSIDTLRSLEDALLAFAGTALVVSHDRFFLDRVATHILAFEVDPNNDATCDVKFFEGNYAEYEADRLIRLGDNIPKPLRFSRNQLASVGGR